MTCFTEHVSSQNHLQQSLEFSEYQRMSGATLPSSCGVEQTEEFMNNSNSCSEATEWL